MKRVLIALCLVVIVLVAAISALPLLVSSTTVRTAVLEHFRELTGREVAIGGSPSITINPFFAIELENVTIADPRAPEDGLPLLHVAKVQARIEVLPALLGRIRFDQYRLLTPRLNLKVYPDGMSNWEFERGLFHDAISQAQSDDDSQGGNENVINARLGGFTILDGAIQYEDAISGIRRQVTGMEGNISWPATNRLMLASGSGIWRGENVSLTTSIQNPVALMAGGESGLEFSMLSTPVSVSFEGNANMISNLFLQGQVELASPSARRISEFLDAQIGDFGSISVAGDLEATAQSMRLANAELGIAESSATGALSLSFDESGNSKIDGTLAFDTLDFSSFLTNGNANNTENTIAEQTGNTEVDLRVSANSVDIGFMRLVELAAVVTADGSGWFVDIGDSSTFGGNLIAKFGERTEGDRKEGFLEATVSGVDAAELSSLFSGHKIRFAGNSTLKADLRSENILELLKRNKISGFLEARFEQGSIEGIDLPKLLDAAADTENEYQERVELGDETNFTQANAKLFVTNSVATIAKSAISVGDRVIQLFGRVDLRQGNLSLRALEVISDGEQSERLFIGGTLQAPLVSVKRIRKSGSLISRERDLASVE